MPTRTPLAKPGRRVVSAARTPREWRWLWQGLCVCIPFWEGGGAPFDLAARQRADTIGGTPDWERDTRGLAVSFTGAAEYYLWPQNNGNASPSDEITIWARFKWDGASGSWRAIVQKDHTSPVWGSYYMQQSSSGTSWLAGIGVSGVNYETPTIAAIPTTRYLNFFLRWRTGQPMVFTLLEDGGAQFGQVQTVASPAGTVSYNGGAFAVGRNVFEGAGAGINGDVSIVCVWTRRLNDQQIRQLARHSFGFLQPARPLKVGAGPITINAQPVALPVAITTHTRTFGALTFSPAPVRVSTRINTPVLTKGALTFAPTPRTLPIVIPAATLTLGAKTLTAAPVVIPVTIPTHGFSEGGGAVQTFAASPIRVPVVVPTAIVTFGARTLAATPVALPVVVTAPQQPLFGALPLNATPIALPVVVQAPSVTRTPLTVNATPIRLPIIVTEPGLTGITFQQFGAVIRNLDPTDWTTGTQFFLEATLKTTNPAFPAKARLYNISDGVPISGSEVQVAAVAEQTVRSTAFTLPSGPRNYRIEFYGTVGPTYNCSAADLRYKEPAA